MPQTIISLKTQLVKFDTTLQFEEVISRLEKQVNKAGSRNILARIHDAKDQSELGALIQSSVGESEFLYFSEMAFHSLIESLEGTSQPKLVVYTIGNPLVAQKILRNNRLAACHVPLRLLIAEKRDRSGTMVAYHLPSSAMNHPAGKNDSTLQKQIKLLDQKIGRLVSRITDYDTKVGVQNVQIFNASRL